MNYTKRCTVHWKSDHKYKTYYNTKQTYYNKMIIIFCFLLECIAITNNEVNKRYVTRKLLTKNPFTMKGIFQFENV